LFAEAGVFAGLAAAIWAGYDPQGPLQSMNNRKGTIEYNKIYNTKGSAIQVFSTDDLTITNNECYSYNEVQSVDNGGIEAGRLGFNRNTRMNISDNTCVSLYGYGVLAGNSRQMKVAGNEVRSQRGIRMDSP